MKLWMLATLGLGLIPGGASGQSTYKLPPPEVVKILDASPTPGVALSPARDSMLLVEPEGSHPPIRQLARPFLGLAGSGSSRRSGPGSGQSGTRGLRWSRSTASLATGSSCPKG
jgi:hypothetical protein